MGKMTVTISVDANNWPIFKKQVGNASGHIDNYVSTFLASKGDDATVIDIDILKTEVKQLQESMTEIQAELTNKQQQMDSYFKMQEQRDLERLKKEKEAQEALFKCKICRCVIQDKEHNVGVGKVCDNCYHTQNDKVNELIREWRDQQ